jgi:hypothetical protein
VKLAANQPYLFPYIGYFQLIRAADVFVISDDFNYIRQGWINRNRILLGGKPRFFSVPILDRSCFREIRETCVSPDEYPRWREKFFGTLEHAYRRATNYDAVLGLLSDVFTESVSTIAELARSSILSVRNYLGIRTQIRETSSVYGNHELRKAERIYDMCRRENADTYVNAIGGVELYSKSEFAQQGISLYFVSSSGVAYEQHPRMPFVPNLSVIDVLMFNSVEQIHRMLDDYELI